SNLIPEVCSKWAEAYNNRDMEKVIAEVVIEVLLHVIC
ncbi:hypothetical protein QOS_1132, partial [Clostridioides difficile Y184]